MLTRCLTGARQADVRLEPLPVLIHQAHQGNRRFARQGSQTRQTIEKGVPAECPAGSARAGGQDACTRWAPRGLCGSLSVRQRSADRSPLVRRESVDIVAQGRPPLKRQGAADPKCSPYIQAIGAGGHGNAGATGAISGCRSSLACPTNPGGGAIPSPPGCPGGGGGLDAAVDATMRSREHLMALDRIAQMRTSSEHARHQSNA
jgi:hypothetical protein